MFFTIETNAQWLLLKKGGKEHYITSYDKGLKYTLILKDGTTYKGQIDSINSKSIIISTKEAGLYTIDLEKIKAIKENKSIWVFYVYSCFIRVNKTYKLKKWKYKFVSSKN